MYREMPFLFPLSCIHQEKVLDMMLFLPVCLHLALLNHEMLYLFLVEFRVKRNLLINVLLRWLFVTSQKLRILLLLLSVNQNLIPPIMFIQKIIMFHMYILIRIGEIAKKTNFLEGWHLLIPNFPKKIWKIWTMDECWIFIVVRLMNGIGVICIDYWGLHIDVYLQLYNYT